MDYTTQLQLVYSIADELAGKYTGFHMKQDSDLPSMTPAQLRQEVQRLRQAVRKHRDTQENARCWHNDLVLYGTLSEEVKPGRMLGDEKQLLQNCQRYIRRQRCAQDCSKK